jgi:site-specific DNA-methyltransferase (adenine-specific)
LHSAQKPIELFKYLIATYTKEGETVLDFCAGSGTTAISAESIGRKWILIEKDERCCEIITKRLNKHNFVLPKLKRKKLTLIRKKI